MIDRLAAGLTGWFIQQGLLQQEDYEVYVYCIDSLLVKLFYYVALLTAAIYLHIVPQTVLYCIGFTAFRYTAGGYHAKSAGLCMVLTLLVFTMSMITIQYIAPFTMATSAGSIVCVVLGTIVAVKHAPIDHFNKPVSAERKLQMRRYCLLFQLVFMLLVLLLIALRMGEYALCLALGNGVAAVFLLYAYYTHQGGTTV
ncbi:MAG: accessory gene regulator B family protein [Peptococcaceae bacterium]|nr:accessory gene regulator B family protein [Peptococcaceae bacterium]